MGSMIQFPDQAAGLRRMFSRRSVRVLPVLIPPRRCDTRAVWLTKLAEGFARQGNRMLVIDAARVQVAAAIGLRARFDLLHALRGECALEAVLLDAAPGLAVLPAARALEQAARQRQSLQDILAACRRLNTQTDLVLVLLPAEHATVLPAGDALVPVQATRDDVGAALADIRRAHELADNVAFRLLFLGIEEGAAATLAQRMMASAALWSTASVSYGGAACVARDLVRVVRAASGWDMAQLATAEMETSS